MTRGVMVELESFRLAQYANHVHCLICHEGNKPDAENCRRCFAPMILAHQAQARDMPPVMLATLGPSGVGKTVYLGMLMDMLSRQGGRWQLAARGGFSISLQQTTLAALARCEFPIKTPNEPDRWNWVHCQLRNPKHRHGVNMVMPDIAGEALFEEVEHPHSYQIIHWLLTRCQGVLVLIDATKLESGSLDEDYHAMKLVSHLNELGNEQRSGWNGRPVALVFSKADQCETCFDDPEDFARRHVSGLWRFCRERFAKHRFFAAGVAGACASVVLPGGAVQSIPLRVEPRGIVEPFEWLVESLRK